MNEGKVAISSDKTVFYNPIQEFNRDMSIAAIQTSFAEQFTVLEAFAASGLRSMRYAKEIPLIREITANDLDPKAVLSISQNAALNGITNITPVQGDANHTMHSFASQKKYFDVIDLDPYGTAAPFIDAAIQTIANGGLLCVTCTDMAVLAGSQPGACFAKYSGINLPLAPFTHELVTIINQGSSHTAS
jgi:tRNA (guanine26-N2/guanine27-N2)-dimethyltransferase